MKSQAKLYGQIHKVLVLIAYASSEGSNEPVHSQSRQSLPCSYQIRNITQNSGQLYGHVLDIKVLIFNSKEAI